MFVVWHRVFHGGSFVVGWLWLTTLLPCRALSRLSPRGNAGGGFFYGGGRPFCKNPDGDARAGARAAAVPPLFLAIRYRWAMIKCWCVLRLVVVLVLVQGTWHVIAIASQSHDPLSPTSTAHFRCSFMKFRRIPHRVEKGGGTLSSVAISLATPLLWLYVSLLWRCCLHCCCCCCGVR